MTGNNESNFALETLKRVRDEKAGTLETSLVEKCYAIQNKHQFNDDRHQSYAAMKRLIEDALERQFGGTGGQE